MLASLLQSGFFINPSALTCLDNALGDPRNEFKHNDASDIRPRSYHENARLQKLHARCLSTRAQHLHAA
jgi:hypothetical protein